MFQKKYKKGLADASKAYEDFGKKQEEAILYILNEVRSGRTTLENALKNDIVALNANITNLYDYLENKEKESLYTVYTPYDLRDLSHEEKLFLIGALFRLTMDEKLPTEAQQKFIRSVQRYLDIKEPPFGVDLTAIENIESMNAQKAIYQVVLEFLSLQDGDNYDETDLQREFLDSFNLNSRNRQTIEERVNILFAATGVDGISEKYGFVDEERILNEEEKELRQKAEELSRIHEEEKNQKIKESIVGQAIQYLYNSGTKCAETSNYILFCENDKTAQYVIIEKSTGDIFNISIPELKINNTYLLSGFKLPWFVVDDLVYRREGQSIYQIDLCTKDVVKLPISMTKDIEILEVLPQYVVAEKNDSGHRSIVLYNVEDGCCETIENVQSKCLKAYRDGFIYMDYTNLKYYSVAEKHLETLIEIENSEGFNIDKFYTCGNCIFGVFLKYIDYNISKYEIRMILFENGCYIAKSVANGILYNRSVQCCYNGFCFIGEANDFSYKNAPSFDVLYFSFDTLNVIKVADNCGYALNSNSGFLKSKESKSYFYRIPISVDSYLIYNASKSPIQNTFKYVDINHPMIINTQEKI